LRIDKFLNVVNIVKRRSISEDMCKSKVVQINGVTCKAAKDVKVGDIITINYLKGDQIFEVLKIPVTKSIPKSQKDEYVKEL